jgi:hypothetical protein
MISTPPRLPYLTAVRDRGLGCGVLPLPEGSVAVRLAVAAARRNCCRWRRLAGRACDVGGDNIGRVPVQAAAGPVISHRGPRVRVGGGFLHVAQRDPGIQTGREHCSNHAEYLSRSRAPGGYSQVGDYGYGSPRPWSRARSGGSTGRLLRRVTATSAAWRPSACRVADGRAVGCGNVRLRGAGMHEVQRERLVARSGA